jgi:archaeal cell division control protein 6
VGVTVLKEKSLSQYFEKYLEKGSVFVNKQVLQTVYTPSNIPHREKQSSQIAAIIAPVLRKERPSNLFIYGKTGTGKTLTVMDTTTQLLSVAKQKSIPVKRLWVNCKLKNVADTEYRVITTLARELGRDLPFTGLHTNDVYNEFFAAVDSKKQIIILVLDEIEQLAKKAGDDVLYSLIRMNEKLKNAQISIIGISNDLMFTDNLDPRVKSSLSEEELLFPPYNALQLKDILSDRSSTAFRKDALGSGTLEKCSAYAAREHGDTRRALDLLRVAGELADRKGASKVGIKEVDEAEEKIDKDKVAELITTQPKQAQIVLHTIFVVGKGERRFIFTGEVYELYKKLCTQLGLRPLTQRRVSDILSELDMLGVITARVISKGRYGRTREIMLTPQASTPSVKKILDESLTK